MKSYKEQKPVGGCIYFFYGTVLPKFISHLHLHNITLKVNWSGAFKRDYVNFVNIYVITYYNSIILDK